MKTQSSPGVSGILLLLLCINVQRTGKTQQLNYVMPTHFFFYDGLMCLLCSCQEIIPHLLHLLKKIFAILSRTWNRHCTSPTLPNPSVTSELNFPARSHLWWGWFLCFFPSLSSPHPTQAVWAHLMNKRQRVNMLYYVNIRFIANVQSYPKHHSEELFQGYFTATIPLSLQNM